jgi:hypothetical protein
MTLNLSRLDDIRQRNEGVTLIAMPRRTRSVRPLAPGQRQELFAAHKNQSKSTTSIIITAMSIPDSSCETMLKEFTSFLEFARERGFALSSFRYDGNNFGDWELQLDAAYRRFRVNWYGRDGQLSVARKILRQPKGSPSGWRPEWEEVAHVPDDTATQLRREDALETARRVLISVLSV